MAERATKSVLGTYAIGLLVAAVGAGSGACAANHARPGALDASGIDTALADIPLPDLFESDFPGRDGTLADLPLSPDGGASDGGDGASTDGNTAGPGITLGPGSDIATFVQREALGFQTGLFDGQMGALMDGTRWTFYGSLLSGGGCGGSPGVQGAYRLGGTPDAITAPYGCAAVIRDHAGGPPLVGRGTLGYFDRDYVGGGPVQRVVSADGARRAVVMVYHAEFHWGAMCGLVPCFYGSLGMAVSTDGGATFRPLGEIVQPYATRAEAIAMGGSLDVGSGTLVLGDANGAPLPDPTAADPFNSYFYVFYTDRDPTEGCPGLCLAVARARVSDVSVAAFGGAVTQGLFRKYWRGGFTTPGVSGDPNDAMHAGHVTRVVPDPALAPAVLYDRTIGRFLLAYQSTPDILVRTAPTVLAWSDPVPGVVVHEPGNEVRFPSLIGETGDPAIGAAAPWLFYSSVLEGGTWRNAVFRRHVLQVVPGP